MPLKPHSLNSKFYLIGQPQLQKVKGLEKKITEEGKHLGQSVDNMERDIEKYDNLTTLEERSDSTKQYLIEMKQRLDRRSTFLDGEARKISSQFKQNKDLLERCETWQSLKKMEGKLCRNGQIVYTLKEFVSRNGRQTNYDISKRDSLHIVNQLNAFLLSPQ